MLVSVGEKNLHHSGVNFVKTVFPSFGGVNKSGKGECV